MNQCPYCEKNIPSGTRTCPECGRRLPPVNRALDAFGGTIPALFQAVHGFFGKIIPGKAGDIIGNALGFAAVMVYIILIMLLLVLLFVAARALLTGRIGDMNWLEETLDIFGALSDFAGNNR